MSTNIRIDLKIKISSADKVMIGNLESVDHKLFQWILRLSKTAIIAFVIYVFGLSIHSNIEVAYSWYLLISSIYLSFN